MADDGNAGLVFIVGGLTVVVLIIAGFLFWGGGGGEPAARDIDVEVSLPEAPGAPGGD